MLPSFAALRQHFTGSQEPGGPDAVRHSLLAAIDDAVALGGHTALVLHTWMIELERDVVNHILARVSAGVASGELWAARGAEAELKHSDLQVLLRLPGEGLTSRSPGLTFSRAGIWVPEHGRPHQLQYTRWRSSRCSFVTQSPRRQGQVG